MEIYIYFSTLQHKLTSIDLNFACDSSMRKGMILDGHTETQHSCALVVHSHLFVFSYLICSALSMFLGFFNAEIVLKII